MLLGSIAESHGARPLGIAHLGRRHAAWTYEGCGHMLRLVGTQPGLRRAAWAHSRPGHSAQPRKRPAPQGPTSLGTCLVGDTPGIAFLGGGLPGRTSAPLSAASSFAVPGLRHPSPALRILFSHPTPPACALVLSFDGVGGPWRFSFGVMGSPWRRPFGDDGARCRTPSGGPPEAA